MRPVHRSPTRLALSAAAPMVCESRRITPDISLLEPGQLERSAHNTRFLEVRGK